MRFPSMVPFLVVTAMFVAALFVGEVKAGSSTSCAGYSAASCAGSMEVRAVRTPVRSLFAQMRSARQARVEARSTASCSGSYAVPKVKVLSACPSCE